MLYCANNAYTHFKSSSLASHLENLKAGDVKDPDEAGPLALGAVQRLVDAHHDPLEHALVQSLGNGLHCKLHLAIVHDPVKSHQQQIHYLANLLKACNSARGINCFIINNALN